MTPLHVAIAIHDIKMVQLLLNHGASVQLSDKKGRSVLALAVDEEQGDIAQLLAAVGAPLLLDVTAAVISDGGMVPWTGLSDVMFEELAGLNLSQQAAVQVRARYACLYKFVFVAYICMCMYVLCLRAVSIAIHVCTCVQASCISKVCVE